MYGEDAERLAALHRELAQRLGEDALATARARGRAMTDQQVVAFARDAIRRHAGD